MNNVNADHLLIISHYSLSFKGTEKNKLGGGNSSSKNLSVEG